MNLPLAETDLGFVISSAVLFIGGLRGLYMLPGIWRDEINYPPNAPPWWLWGQPLWSGFTRGGPAAVLTVAPASLFGLIAALNEIVFRLSESVVLILLLAMLACGLIGAVLITSVSLFCRPALLIAPNRRDESGAMTVWLADWKRRRQNRGSSKD